MARVERPQIATVRLENTSGSIATTNSRVVDKSKLKALITEAFRATNDAKDKSIVLVIGNTGAGKSTTINYLLGCPMEEIDGPDGIPRIAVKETGRMAAKIGHSLSISQTLYPEVFESSDGSYFCDCAGFGDSRGPEYPICVAIATKLAVKSSRHVKSIIIVIEQDSLTAERAYGLRSMFRTLQVFFSNREDSSGNMIDVKSLQDNIIFAITKINPKKNTEAIINAIKNEHSSSATQTPETASIIFMCNLMLANISNMIHVDPLDGGKSRDAIIKCISRAKFLLPEHFGFPAESSIKKELQDFLEQMAALGIKIINDLAYKPDEIKKKMFSRIAEEQVAKDLQTNRQAVLHRVIDENIPAVKSIESLLRENHASLVNKKQEFAELKAKRLFVEMGHLQSKINAQQNHIHELEQRLLKLKKAIHDSEELNKKLQMESYDKQLSEVMTKIRALEAEMQLLEELLAHSRAAYLKEFDSFYLVEKIAGLIEQFSSPLVTEFLTRLKAEESKLELWKKQAHNHTADIKSWLAYAYIYGIGSHKYSFAIHLLQMARNESLSLYDASSLLTEGIQYLYGIFRSKIEPEKAAELFQKAANLGYAPAQFFLAECFSQGLGVSKNIPKAIYYYRLAVEQEFVWAQYKLATCYEMGYGVSVDRLEAVRLYLTTGAQGHIDAKLRAQKIVQEHKKAYLQWNPAVLSRLAVFYEEALVVERNIVEAVRLFRKAAEKKDPLGLFKLGFYYDTGKGGVAKNKIEAVGLYHRAAVAGYNTKAKIPEYPEGLKDYNRALDAIVRSETKPIAEYLPIIYGYIAQTCIDQEEALLFYSKAIESGANNEWLKHMYRGRAAIYEKQKKYILAIEDYKKDLPHSENSITQVSLNLAKACVMSAKSNRSDFVALNNYEEALKYVPTFPEALEGRGIIFFKLNQLDKAQSDFDQVIRLKPDLIAPYAYRGRILFGKAQYANAILDFNKAIELSGDASTVEDYYLQAMAHYHVERYDLSILQFGKAIEKDHAHADAWYYRGRSKHLKNQLGEAERDYTQSLIFDPNRADAYFYRGLTRHDTAPLNALADYNEAIRRNSNFTASAYYYRGMLNISNKNFDNAINDFSAAIRSKRNYKEAYIACGNAYMSKGQYTEAIRWYTQVTKLNPSSASEVVSQCAAAYEGIRHRDLPIMLKRVNNYYCALTEIIEAWKTTCKGEDRSARISANLGIFSSAKDVAVKTCYLKDDGANISLSFNHMGTVYLAEIVKAQRLLYEHLLKKAIFRKNPENLRSLNSKIREALGVVPEWMLQELPALSFGESIAGPGSRWLDDFDRCVATLSTEMEKEDTAPSLR